MATSAHHALIHAQPTGDPEDCCVWDEAKALDIVLGHTNYPPPAPALGSEVPYWPTRQHPKKGCEFCT